MSSIGIGGPHRHLGEDLEHHLAVCAGEYCACCDAWMTGAAETRRGFRLCTRCWPDSTVPWTQLHASLQWSREDGWTLCICYPTPEPKRQPIAVWLLLHDRAECTAILDRYLCCKRDRAAFEKLSDNAGHITIGLFVGPRRLIALAEATRRDPRTAYDKRRQLRTP